MTTPLNFTGTYELRRPGDGNPVLFTGTVTGQVAFPTSALPTATPPAATPTASSTATPAAVATLGSRVKLGAFVYQGLPGGGGSGDPWDPAPHFALEKALGRRLSPVSCFIGWDQGFPAGEFAAYGDRDILISWHPDVPSASDILTGRWDAYLDRWAAAVEQYRAGRVYIRLMPEMNGSWARWCPAYSGPTPMGIDSPATYVQVWRYVVTRVRKTTSRVKWVFCPNITDEPGRDGNRLEQFYPGAAYTDILGFDGYNWGDSNGGTFRWTSFADLIGKPQGGATRSIYSRLTALHTTMPIWVCEFGCKEPAREDGKWDTTSAAVAVGLSPSGSGQSKAQWYTDALRLTGYSRLDTLVMFDVLKERDWRLASSPEVVQAVAANLTSAATVL